MTWSGTAIAGKKEGLLVHAIDAEVVSVGEYKNDMKHGKYTVFSKIEQTKGEDEYRYTN